jgi:hypothetical protein
MRPQLLEGALLVLAGVAGGAVIAPVSVDAIRQALSSQAYALDVATTVDRNTFLFIAVIAVAGTVVACWASLWHSVRVSNGASLRTQESVSSAGLRLGDISAVTQVAVSVILLTFTFMFAHNYLGVANRRTGFDTQRILIASTSFARQTTPAGMRDLYRSVEQRLRTTAGVEETGIALAMPGGNNALTPWLELADGTKLPQGMQGVMANPVTPGWLPAMGIDIVAGRGLTDADMGGGPRVMVVTREFERRFLPQGFAPGMVIYERPAPDGPRQPVEIVGVAEDSAYLFIKEAFPPTAYMPLFQSSSALRFTPQITIRANHGNPARLSKLVADAIAQIDPAASFSFRTLADQIGTQYARERLIAGLAIFLSGFALILAAVGVYAVFASTVAYRVFEVAVRMAVGATPARILASLFTRAAIWTTLGVAIGVALTFAANQVVQALLFQTDPGDAIFRIESVAVLAVSLLLGAAVPAIRATRINPSQLLR